MKNWLSKTATKPVATGKRSLPATQMQGRPPAAGGSPPRTLPPATIVYGCAAGAFFAFALLLLWGRHWLDGCLTFIPGLIFVGFAVHLMKHGQPRR